MSNNNVFSKYLDKFVLVFLDNILIYSKNEAKHEENLRLVLQVLWENQLYAKLNECDFFQSKVQYLGHVFPKDGIIVEPKKISTIMEHPTSKDVSYVRYFLGLEGYYWRFINGFSNIAHSITSLQNKNVEFVWS